MDKERFNYLIKRINFDKEALIEIYTYYFPAVVFSLTKTIRDKELAKDIAQDFFYKKIFNITIPDYIEFPQTWILHSCKNLAFNYYKKEIKTVEFREAILATNMTDDDNIQVDEERLSTRNQSQNDEQYFESLLYANISDDLVNAFKKLGRETTEIYILYYFEKFTQEEISKIMNINFSTLRSKIRRGAKLLKILLQTCNILLLFCGLYR